jgi:hypothetical protein
VKDGHNCLPAALLYLKGNLHLSPKGLKVFDRNLVRETFKSKEEFFRRFEDTFAL